MNRNKYTLPDWFEGEVYDEGDTITNPFSGEHLLLRCWQKHLCMT